MIKIKIQKGKVKIKAAGEEFMVIREIAFGAAACINEMVDGKAEFDRVKTAVIDELSKFTLTEDEKEFDFKSL